MNKIQSCVIQVKYTACISSRVNAVKCEMSVFLMTVAFGSVVEFDQLGILLCLTRGRGEERGERSLPLKYEGGGSLPFEYEG